MSCANNLKSKNLKALVFKFFSAFYAIAFSYLEKQFIVFNPFSEFQPESEILYRIYRDPSILKSNIVVLPPPNIFTRAYL